MNETSKSAGTKHEENQYGDIIHLPRHVSVTHPQMSLHDRAAQFPPFAALTGHDAAVKETSRLTEGRIELDENSRESLDEKMRMIQEQVGNHPKITFTYFKPDQRKEGGAYVDASGFLKKIDIYNRVMVLQGGEHIPICDVICIDGDLFRFIGDSSG